MSRTTSIYFIIAILILLGVLRLANELLFDLGSALNMLLYIGMLVTFIYGVLVKRKTISTL